MSDDEDDVGHCAPEEHGRSSNENAEDEEQESGIGEHVIWEGVDTHRLPYMRRRSRGSPSGVQV